MKKSEFQRLINRAKKLLVDGDGCCCALNYACNGYMPLIVKDFQMFRPFGDRRRVYWLGTLTKENLKTRIKTLEAFEEIVITAELYLEY